MNRIGRLVLVVFAFCGLGLVPGVEGHTLRVLTSFLPVYCFAANVAGDLAIVENLLPANVEPHDYQFSRKDLQKLSHADLIVVNGLGLETWLSRVFHDSTSHPKVVEISAGLEPDLIYAGDRRTSSLRPNPHIWLDPRLSCHAVTNILRALQQADPANADKYAINAARYVTQLERLDTELRERLAPVKGASVVTYHDAFPYFARRYGLNIIGVIEPVPDVEPSLKYLAALYRTIRAKPVQAIFTEPPTAPRLARQIGSDLRLPVVELDPLEAGALKPDAYEQAMRNNGHVFLKYLKRDASGPVL